MRPLNPRRLVVHLAQGRTLRSWLVSDSHHCPRAPPSCPAPSGTWPTTPDGRATPERSPGCRPPPPGRSGCRHTRRRPASPRDPRRDTRHLAPLATPAAVRICGPWQMAAMGLSALGEVAHHASTFGLRRRYSGARPPAMTSAS